MEIVSFELAKKLKEKGYPQKHMGEYEMLGPTYIDDGILYENGCITEVAEAYSAPTISQVLKRLREEHQIHIFADITSAGWFHKISIKVKLDDTRYWFSKALTESDFFDTYEEAIVAGMEYVLDNLI